jgi:hypothetical protein
VIAAAGAAAGEDCARLRFGARFLVARAADFLAAGEGDDAAAAEDAFAWRLDEDAATGADDFASRAEDDDADGGAAILVASPKASARAALIAAGDASFERLRVLERVLRGDADLFAPGAAAFCFFEFGIEALQDSRIDERMVGQLQLVLKSEDDANEHIVVRGTQQPAGLARRLAR